MGDVSQPVLQFDLSTSEGLITMITESLHPRLLKAFEDAGNLPMGVVIIATRYEGKQLASPRSVVVLSHSGEDDPGAFLHRTYHWASRDCGALGTITIGMTWIVNLYTPKEVERWERRNVREHPKAVEALVCMLEHKRFGVRSWVSRISGEGKDRKAAAFQPETEDMKAPTAGFLETLRAVS